MAYAASKRISHSHPTFDLRIIEDNIQLDWNANEKKQVKAFYPYSTEQCNLNIEVTLLNSDLKTLTNNEIEITAQSLGKDEEIAGWMEVFGIERYKAKLLGKHAGKKWYNTLKDGINNAKKI